VKADAHDRTQPPLCHLAGYRPGALGRLVELHGRYYAKAAGFGAPFEAKIAAGIAEFSCRLDRPANQLWLARRHEDIVGAIAIDGEDMGAGIARLRWFIVAKEERGRGLGRKLLGDAVAFC